MEEIKTLLKRNDNDFMIYSDENDSDNETLTASNLKKYISDASILNAFNVERTEDNLCFKKQNIKERLPTRKPDPNVYNRNALLARENRKKKKMYLETIEKELLLARKANRVLLKALKHQIKIRRQLEEEKMVFSELIAGRSNKLYYDRASESSTTSESETNKSFPISSSLGSQLLNSEDESEMPRCNDSVLGGETRSECFSSSSDDLENDASLRASSLIWDDLWSNNTTNADYVIEQDSFIAQNNNVLRDVNNDHCYVTNLDGLKALEENYPNDRVFNASGMSSYHTQGEFSEIFCSTPLECRTPPLQLLDDKL